MKRWLFIVLGLAISATAAGQTRLEIEEAEAFDDDFNPQVNEYDVVEGDTLWDISERVVGDPYKWPKVWALNPEITNPHWIYPGDRIRFFESNLEPPSTHELIAGSMPMPDDYELQEGDGITGDSSDVEEIGGADSMAGTSSGPDIEMIDTVARRSNRGLVYRYLERFVTPKELQEAGVLTNASPDAILLSTGDLVYLRFPSSKRPEMGEALLSYRTTTEVYHPESGSHRGYLTQITGVLQVESPKEDSVTKARVKSSFFEIERGNYVTPVEQDLLIRLVKVPTANEVKGLVMAVRYGFESVAGDLELVYIDKGKSHGLERGNQLRVMVDSDYLTGETDDGMLAEIGLLQVVDARSNASTCLVMRARREIEPGAMVQTVVDASAAPPPAPESAPAEESG